ncbi:MAG TPA: MotA/TolQ/ExbB proton channel family protein [Candidatus Limnocylindria bacterium]|jgi:biopolymer transport protein ExbB|nr:MotA/TolQ/ExbB proton channel family protein [Candidatus Limnocylindria bacterium]
MLELFKNGGPFFYVLLLLSVAAVALIGERAWALRRSIILPRNLLDSLADGDSDRLRAACAVNPSPLGRLIVSVLDHLPWSKSENISALEVKARLEMAEMERNLVFLEIIVGIAPLLGLVGTIYGIIPLFGDFGQALSGDNALIAKGIGAALNKTVMGLVVAIPSLVAWSLFTRRVEGLALEMESLCDAVLRRHYLSRKPGGRDENAA